MKMAWRSVKTKKSTEWVLVEGLDSDNRDILCDITFLRHSSHDAPSIITAQAFFYLFRRDAWL